MTADSADYRESIRYQQYMDEAGLRETSTGQAVAIEHYPLYQEIAGLLRYAGSCVRDKLAAAFGGKEALDNSLMKIRFEMSKGEQNNEVSPALVKEARHLEDAIVQVRGRRNERMSIESQLSKVTAGEEN